MSVFRVEKTSDYTVMSNYHFKEKEMSLKAKGLLSLMLSLPDTWDYTISGLVSICKENETAIKSALNELKEFGYLQIIKNMPTSENGGRISYEYIVHEKPIQKDKKQPIENLYLENQYVENQSQLNTNILNTKYKTNIDKSILVNNVENKQISKNDLILKENIKCIIDYLNDSIGSKYKYTTKGTINLIKARFRDGFVLDDFYDVIDKKVKEWIDNPEMCKYLRPETLFGNKFESYLNGKVFNGKPKSSYSSTPTFDNTKDHDLGNKPITDDEFDNLSFKEKQNYVIHINAYKNLTNKQEEFYIQYCAPKDENGNLLEF